VQFILIVLPSFLVLLVVFMMGYSWNNPNGHFNFTFFNISSGKKRIEDN